MTVLAFPGINLSDPDAILDAAKGKLSEVVVIGLHHDGTPWSSGSTAYMPDIVWMIERARHDLLSHDGATP